MPTFSATSSNRTGSTPSNPKGGIAKRKSSAPIRTRNNQVSYSQDRKAPPPNASQPFKPAGAVTDSSPLSSPQRSRYWYNQSQEASGLNKAHGTEHGAKYVAWDVINSPPTSPARQRTSLGNYIVSSGPSSWQSVQERDYTNNYPMTKNLSGDSRVAGLSTNKENKQFPSSFAWDSNSNKPELPKTDYYDRIAELRNKQKTIGVNKPAKTAMKATKNKKRAANQPAVEPENIPEPEHESVAEPPQRYPYDMGTSEYKLKYKEWPIDQLVKGDNEVGQSTIRTSKVFPSEASDSFAHLRQTSLYRDSYPEYDATARRSASPDPSSRDANEKKPPVFAWNLLDGQEPTPQSAPAPPVHHQASEYAKKFVAHPPQAYEPSKLNTSNIIAEQSNAMSSTLFPDAVNRIKSEYLDQFNEKEIDAQGIIPKSAARSSSPAQFAWTLVDGSKSDGEESPKPRRARVIHSDLSETSSKFKWPVANEPTVVRKPEDNTESKIGKVFALDDNSDPAQMQSEYDAQCAKLRQKQSDILKSSSFVAGVPSVRLDKAPSFFAWSDAPLPPPPAYKATHVSPEAFSSEYGENFQAQRVAPILPFGPKGDGLNLFEGPSNAPQQSAASSEYDSQFQARKAEGASSVAIASRPVNSNPPQFAWPLIDTQPIPAPRPKSTNSNISEAQSKFVWQQTDAIPQRAPEASSEAPMGLFEDSGAAQWKSEYAEQSSAAAKSSSPKPAGIIAIRDEDVPSFFAWADQEEKRPATRPAPANPLDIVNTTYHDEFKPFVPSPPRSFKEHLESTQLNLFPSSSPDAESKPAVTEYDANYSSALARENSGSAFRRVDVGSTRPSQFAWNLVDPVVQRVKPSPRTPPAEEATETQRSFAWPSVSERQELRPSAAVDHFKSNATLLETDQGKTTDWRSEYDDRCREVTTQIEVSPRLSANRAKSAPRTPSFFAWQDEPREKVVVIARKPVAPLETSEYRDRFVQASAEVVDKSHAVLVATKDEVGSLLQQEGPRFRGASEYSDQFNDINTTKCAAPSQIITYKDMYSASLPSTNLDRVVQEMDWEKQASQRPSSAAAAAVAAASEGKARHMQSEAGQQFSWPEKIPAAPHTPRGVASSVSVADALTRRDVGRENISSTMNLPLRRFQSGETEYQREFSWPSAAKKPSQSSPVSSPKRAGAGAVDAAKRYKVMQKSKSSAYKPTFSRLQQQLIRGASRSATAQPTSRASSSGGLARTAAGKVAAQSGDRDEFSDLGFQDSSAVYDNEPLPLQTATASSAISQDSLNPPKITFSESPASPVSVSEQLSPAREDRWVPSKSIPGLRDYDEPYRSRSAPIRRRVGSAYFDTNLRTPIFLETSHSNPVLMNTRYPSISDQQATRWITENQAKYKNPRRSGSPIK